MLAVMHGVSSYAMKVQMDGQEPILPYQNCLWGNKSIYLSVTYVMKNKKKMVENEKKLIVILEKL